MESLAASVMIEACPAEAVAKQDRVVAVAAQGKAEAMVDQGKAEARAAPGVAALARVEAAAMPGMPVELLAAAPAEARGEVAAALLVVVAQGMVGAMAALVVVALLPVEAATTRGTLGELLVAARDRVAACPVELATVLLAAAAPGVAVLYSVGGYMLQEAMVVAVQEVAVAPAELRLAEEVAVAPYVL